MHTTPSRIICVSAHTMRKMSGPPLSRIIPKLFADAHTIVQISLRASQEFIFLTSPFWPLRFPDPFLGRVRNTRISRPNFYPQSLTPYMQRTVLVYSYPAVWIGQINRPLGDSSTGLSTFLMPGIRHILLVLCSNVRHILRFGRPRGYRRIFLILYATTHCRIVHPFGNLFAR